MASIKATLAQHSIILNNLQWYHDSNDTLIESVNLPNFPLKTSEEFEALEYLLDKTITSYLVSFLAVLFI